MRVAVRTEDGQVQRPASDVAEQRREPSTSPDGRVGSGISTETRTTSSTPRRSWAASSHLTQPVSRAWNSWHAASSWETQRWRARSGGIKKLRSGVTRAYPCHGALSLHSFSPFSSPRHNVGLGPGMGFLDMRGKPASRGLSSPRGTIQQEYARWSQHAGKEKWPRGQHRHERAFLLTSHIGLCLLGLK